ncbi:hypothetical protein B566_EDAN002023 [Ephemera danica]|nr:hypothetical protein B566_EDAN002023 [Ephemera danica]
MIPCYRSQSRAMNQMVNSFFSDPFGDVMGMGMPGMGGFPRLMGGPMGQLMPSRRQQRGQDIMPFGFPNLPLFPGMDGRQMQNMGNMGDCHSFSSSTMVSMTTGPDGRPQVYQASSSTRTAPGGIRETKKAVADSRSGTKKMAIGHHIGERGHIIEREQNVYSGDSEERQDFINLEEGPWVPTHAQNPPQVTPYLDDASTFNREWESRTRRAMGGVSIEDVTDSPSTYVPRGHDRPLLALTSSSSGHARSRTRAPAVSSSSSSAISSARYHRRSISVSLNSESSRYSSQLGVFLFHLLAFCSVCQITQDLSQNTMTNMSITNNSQTLLYEVAKTKL